MLHMVTVVEQEQQVVAGHDHVELVAAMATRGIKQLLIPRRASGDVSDHEHRVGFHGTISG